MKPYYSEPGVTIHQGDCMELMPQLSERPSVIITDPPYGDTALEWDSRLDRWAQVAYLACAESASLWCFGSFRMFYQGDGLRPWRLAQELVWEKHNGSSFHADRFKRVHELIVHFYKGTWLELYKSPVYTNDATARTVSRKSRPPHMNNVGASAYVSVDGGPRLMRSVLYARSCHGQAVHPTQKPVSVIAPLIQYSAGQGAIVLDPFMGSGSVMIACRNAGVQYIGIELSEDYCSLAVDRLRQGVLSLETSKSV